MEHYLHHAGQIGYSDFHWELENYLNIVLEIDKYKNCCLEFK